MFRMTFFTNRHNIKLVFRGITWMMIFLSWFWAIMTKQCVRSRQLTTPNSPIKNGLCFAAFRMFKTPLFLIGPALFAFSKFSLGFQICLSSFFSFPIFLDSLEFCCSTFVALSIAFLGGLTFFGFQISHSVYSLTSLASISKPVFTESVFGEIRNRLNWLNPLAMRTSFRYDCLRHNQFLTNWLCLGRLQAIPVFGSFYCKPKHSEVKSFFEISKAG